MPPIERTNLKDKVVIWSYVRSDRGGEPAVSQPVQIMARWEEGQLELPNPEGSLLNVDAIIATKQNIALNSIIWLGTMNADDTFQDPEGVQYPVTGPTLYLFEVVVRVRATDIKHRATRYEFGLRRYKDALPTVLPSS